MFFDESFNEDCKPNVYPSEESWEFPEILDDLHGGNAMRLACPEQRLDSLPIPAVKLNLNCRDEIIPIWRALQHVYADSALRRARLSVGGTDVKPRTDVTTARDSQNSP